MDVLKYNNKSYRIPIHDRELGCIHIEPQEHTAALPPGDAPVVRDLNTVFDIEKYLEPRQPVSVGMLAAEARADFSRPSEARNVLDLPIKFPGSDFRLPAEYAQWAPVVQQVANVEYALNQRCFDEYYCYFSLRRSVVPAGGVGHHAPCHVDGFQGARWQPKVRLNHTYTIEDHLPTLYFPQPFDLRPLDLAKHDAFWEFNRQVANTEGRFAWNDYRDYELMLMDAYCVHIAAVAPVETHRTWVRITFEVRIYDRLGNGKNPFFRYDWDVQPRDIEQLNLQPFDTNCHPSLRVFPWQALDGTANPPGVYTRPKLWLDGVTPR